MKPTPPLRMHRPKISFRAFAIALLAITGTSRAQESAAKPLTQEEFLHQIDRLSPSGKSNGGSAEATAAPVGAGKPNPLFATGETKTADNKPEKKSKGPTEITASEASFDQKAHLAIFLHEVVVVDPEFNVVCDKLTAYLKHNDKPDPADPGRLTPPPSGTAPKGAGEKNGGLEKAIAEAVAGKVVTVTQQKKEADGSTSNSTGHGRKVVYEAASGDITLTGHPDVQQGINTCIATEDSTIMILNRAGSMRVIGPHKTVIRDQGDASK